MPPRLISVAILLYWVVAASSLIRRDILPELGFVRPPDLGKIARAGGDSEPVHWAVEVVDNPSTPEDRRPVGEALTQTVRTPEGGVVITSRVEFDTGRLLKGTLFANKGDAQIEVSSTSRVDPT